MMDSRKDILNESFGLMAKEKHQSKQQQLSAARTGTKKKKFEISKDELKNGDFDQIVMETSALITRDLRALKLAKLEHYQPDQSCNGSQLLEQDSSNQTSASSSGASESRLDVNQPKRPMNAFMVWGQAIRRELHNKFSNVQNAVLSKALGRVWRRLDSIEKEPYITKANIIKSNHKRDYPDYRYQPRRIQEKQRRLQQNNNHLKQNQQQSHQSNRTASSEARSIVQKQNRSAVITSAASQISYDDLINSQASNAFVIQNGGNEDELWKTNTGGYAWPAAGEPGFRTEHGINASKPHVTDTDKYFQYEEHRGEQFEAEYPLPPIDPDVNANNNSSQICHMSDLQNQVSIDNQLQARLFYGASNEHPKRTDVAVINQSVLNNLCMDGQYQNQNHLLTGQETNSLNIYNSNYRQQYQPHELDQELTQHIQQNQLDLNGFGQYRQHGNEQARYHDTNVRYHQNTWCLR